MFNLSVKSYSVFKDYILKSSNKESAHVPQWLIYLQISDDPMETEGFA